MTLQIINFALRPPHSMLDALRQAAADNGVATNQRVFIVVAEKVVCRRAAKEFLQARMQGGSAQRALDMLAKSGADVVGV